MRNHVCWMCQANTSHEAIIAPKKVVTREAKGFSADANHYPVVVAYQCHVCLGISVGIVDISNNVPFNSALGTWLDNPDNVSDGDFTWRPTASDTKGYPNVPKHIADAATEAFECHAVGHYRAAILLARSVLEATAKDKGITDGVLAKKIEEMEEQNFIRPLIRQVADGIRDYGNEMAHGDFSTPVGQAESETVIKLMGVILEEVYQISAQLAQLQQAVGQRKQGGGPS